MQVEKTWFASWFDTPYYHILYKNRDEKEAQQFITKLLNFLQLPAYSQCLDLACGKGRHARFLSENDLHVTGVDLSQNSIAQAKKMEHERLYFEVQDMRENFCENRFDAIFNLFTSFGYFDHQDDNLKVMQSARKMLKEKGVFIIDFMNTHKVIKHLVKEEVKVVDDITFNLIRKYDGEHIFKHITFTAEGVHHNYTERVQALQLNDFENLLHQAGFIIEQTFGDFDLNPYQKETANRLIIIARKA
jgi:SAM-dependent methyltransferase